ncbi:MAG: hypothetical protein HQM08_16970 [Candidatus Riflebacteria bacterium]|nr:hypothetical protein [Candidatus Riflebacteria bacterium]
MTKNIKLSVLFHLIFFAASVLAISPEEREAQRTVQQEITRILAGTSSFVSNIGAVSDYQVDFQQLLRKFPSLAEPKTVFVEGKTIKILVPFKIDKNTIGGFFQTSPDGKTIWSYPPWDVTLTPLFKVPADVWETATAANSITQIPEMIPQLVTPTPGTPVEPEDLTHCFLIDHISSLPSKTQEEKEDFALEHGFKIHSERRRGSLKCLAYSASFAVDWWKIVLGERLGSYRSILSGAMEYGTNPRMVESMYFATPKSPYSFMKYNILKKDLVTEEKVPYSPKHYAYVMSCISLPDKVNDPLLPNVSYSIPERSLAMDRPFFDVFNKSQGNFDQVRQALESYGILYAQHTKRDDTEEPKDYLGIHSITIVGAGQLKGQDVLLYYETFGKNHKNYIEDGFFGPRLRAFPVEYFYQALAFPHALNLNLNVENGRAIGKFCTSKGLSLSPDKITVTVNGAIVHVPISSDFSVSLKDGVNIVQVQYRKKYFQIPEEPLQYDRLYFISGNRVIELNELENTSLAIATIKRKVPFFEHEVDGYLEFLCQREEDLRKVVVKKLQDTTADPDLYQEVTKGIKLSPILSDVLKGDLSMIKVWSDHKIINGF